MKSSDNSKEFSYYKSLFEFSGDAMLLLDNYRIVDCNQATLDMLGYQSKEQIFSLQPSDLSPEFQADGRPSKEKADEMIQKALTNGSLRFTWTHIRADGEEFPAEVLLTAISHQGKSLLHVTWRDISEQDKRLKDLILAKNVVDNTSEGILITDRNAIIVDVNHAFCQITGYNKLEVIGKKSGFMKSDRHTPEFYQALWKQLVDTGSWEGEIWDRHKEGYVYPKYLKINAIKNSYGQIDYYVGIFSDISEQKQNEQTLQQLAFYDPLTDLANRRLFHDRLEQNIHVCARANKKLAVFAIDLDNFKSINDTQGHQKGDLVLIEVAQKLCEKCSRKSDTIARMGGDEFMIIYHDIKTEKDVSLYAESLLETMRMSYDFGNQHVDLTGSLGISLYPKDAKTTQELISHSDIAMYQAKQKGGNRIEFYAQEVKDRLFHSIALEKEIKLGLERNEFVPFYQPKIDLETGQVVGVEALARWQHSERGLISPAEFIPLAEESDLIIQISQQILAQICQFIKSSHTVGADDFHIAINISARQLSSRSLFEDVHDMINEFAINPRQIELEVTESMVMENMDIAIASLKLFRSVGMNIALDDFGTGYSSLSYLKTFPIDILKIDRSFIKDINDDRFSSDNMIVQAILTMAKSIGLKVVAEGVEDKCQLDYLKSVGCEMVQGYFYSPPLPEKKFIEFLLQHQESNQNI